MSRVRLNNVDLAWLRMDHPNNPMMITVVLQFNGHIDYRRLVDLIRDSLAPYRRFRQCIVSPEKMFSRPYWEDYPRYRAEDHIHRQDLPSPADESSLMDLVNCEMNTQLDFSVPLWQVTLVENAPQGSVLIVRIHHCIADGISLMRVLLKMTTTLPDESVLQPALANAQPADPPPNPAAVGVQPVTPGTPFNILPPTWTETPPANPVSGPDNAVLVRKPKILDILVAIVRILFLRPDPPSIFKGSLGKIKKSVWSQPFSLPEIKKIARYRQATINDVMMALAAGAMRRYSDSHNGLLERDLRSFIMVNLRGREFDVELGNKFGLVFLTLPMHGEHPMHRLDQIKQGMDYLKASAEYAATYVILNVLGMVPAWIERLATKIFDSKGTLVATNVPGPRHVIYLAGVPIHSFKAWVPQSGRIGIGLSILSYNNQVSVGLNVDLGLIPDPEVFLQLFTQEFEALRDVAAAGTMA